MNIRTIKTVKMKNVIKISVEKKYSFHLKLKYKIQSFEESSTCVVGNDDHFTSSKNVSPKYLKTAETGKLEVY